MQRVYSLLVDNNSGVLSRISGLFTRRGYNIDSITAGVTADSRFTRITIVSSGDEIILSQIEKQIAKLEDVIVVKVLKPEESVYRELILVKIRANAQQRSEIVSIADIFRAKIVDAERESLVIELTGTQSKLEAFLQLLDGYEDLANLPEPELPDCQEESRMSHLSSSYQFKFTYLLGGMSEWQQELFIRKIVILSCLEGQTIAVIGYGSQGHAHASERKRVWM